VDDLFFGSLSLTFFEGAVATWSMHRDVVVDTVESISCSFTSSIDISNLAIKFKSLFSSGKNNHVCIAIISPLVTSFVLDIFRISTSYTSFPYHRIGTIAPKNGLCPGSTLESSITLSFSSSSHRTKVNSLHLAAIWIRGTSSRTRVESTRYQYRKHKSWFPA